MTTLIIVCLHFQADHSYIGLKEYLKHIDFMKNALVYPIPNKNCCDDFELQDDMLLVMSKLLDVLLDRLYVMRFIKIESDVGMTIQGYLDCSSLIINNDIFTKKHIDDMIELVKKLMEKLKDIPKDFLFE